MDRYERWGNKAEQRREHEQFKKSPRHARVPLRVLSCADCERGLPQTHPAYLGDRCLWCWEEMTVMIEVEVVEVVKYA